MKEHPKAEVTFAKGGQLTFADELALGVTGKGIDRAKRVLCHYGPVLPQVAVRADGQNEFRLLTGPGIFKAMEETGTNEIPIVIAKPEDAKEEKWMCLQMSLRSDNIGALAQGELINHLVKDHGLPLSLLSNRLGVSKPWLSKRRSLVCDLSDDVKKLVAAETLPPRSAEEVAKLPAAEQLPFARRAIMESLSKDKISKLVALRNEPSTPDEIKKLVLENPSGVPASMLAGIKPGKGKAKQGKAKQGKANPDKAKPDKTRVSRISPTELECQLRFAKDVIEAVCKALRKLDPDAIDRFSGKRLIEGVICQAKDLAELAEMVFERLIELEKGTASSYDDGRTLRQGGDKPFTQGNEERQ